jgi:hypothetical protein
MDGPELGGLGYLQRFCNAWKLSARVSPGPGHVVMSVDGDIDMTTGQAFRDVIAAPWPKGTRFGLRDQPAMRVRSVRAAECGRDGQCRDCCVDVALKCPALRGR